MSLALSLHFGGRFCENVTEKSEGADTVFEILKGKLTFVVTGSDINLDKIFTKMSYLNLNVEFFYLQEKHGEIISSFYTSVHVSNVIPIKLPFFESSFNYISINMKPYLEDLISHLENYKPNNNINEDFN